MQSGEALTSASLKVIASVRGTDSKTFRLGLFLSVLNVHEHTHTHTHGHASRCMILKVHNLSEQVSGPRDRYREATIPRTIPCKTLHAMVNPLDGSGWPLFHDNKALTDGIRSALSRGAIPEGLLLVPHLLWGARWR